MKRSKSSSSTPRLPGFAGAGGPARVSCTAAPLRVEMAVGNTRERSELPIGRSLGWSRSVHDGLEGCWRTGGLRGGGGRRKRRRAVSSWNSDDGALEVSDSAQNTLQAHIECDAFKLMLFKSRTILVLLLRLRVCSIQAS